MNQRLVFSLAALATANNMLLAVVEAKEQARPAHSAAPNLAAYSAAANQARAAQEQLVREQEQQAIRAQQAAKQQQAQQRAAQEQAKEQQVQQRAAQEQAKEQQAQQRAAQEQAKEQQAQHRAAQEQAKEQQAQAGAPQDKRRSPRMEPLATEENEHNTSGRFGSNEKQSEKESNMDTSTSTHRNETLAVSRPVEPHPITGRPIPLQKAISMPMLEENSSPEERQHAQSVTQNLQRHLIALPLNQAPTNYSEIQNASLSNFTNNYPSNVNNQDIFINRQNSFINDVPQYENPYWWQPSSGWRFSNGFILGSLIHLDLNWLRWGWHPYYGPPPEGFVCADDYIPTPWIYFPAYGLWRQPGMMGWAPSGPPFDYTGPITVEILEPRRVNVNDPYTGFVATHIMNVPYFYDAFYNPEFERWGYINRHGYFLWVNL